MKVGEHIEIFAIKKKALSGQNIWFFGKFLFNKEGQPVINTSSSLRKIL